LDKHLICGCLTAPTSPTSTAYPNPTAPNVLSKSPSKTSSSPAQLPKPTPKKLSFPVAKQTAINQRNSTNMGSNSILGVVGLSSAQSVSQRHISGLVAIRLGKRRRRSAHIACLKPCRTGLYMLSCSSGQQSRYSLRRQKTSYLLQEKRARKH